LVDRSWAGMAGWSQVQTPGPLSLASDGSSLDSNFMRRTRAGAARRDHTSPRFVASTGAAPVSIFIHDTQDDAHATLEAGRVQDGMGGGCADKSDPRHRAPLASCHALLALSDRARFKSAHSFPSASAARFSGARRWSHGRPRTCSSAVTTPWLDAFRVPTQDALRMADI
jgi:hypothetical protein